MAARSLVAVGFSGARAADAPLAELAAFAPGGVLVFARNATDGKALPALIAALRNLGPPPPLIAVDQEGGRVARIGDPPVAALPSAMAIGAGRDEARCEQLGLLLGRDLARLGITVDLAPVADTAVAGAHAVIGTRSYGGDPVMVGRFAAAFARGLDRGGVAATLKHFPGHGGVALDSHVALPHVRADADQLAHRELVPFAAALARAPVSLVLLAHVIVDALDPVLPASLSPRVVQLLREDLGFAGVVCTDCLQMGAVAELERRRLVSPRLRAGVDLLLVSHSLAVAADVLHTRWNSPSPTGRCRVPASRRRARACGCCASAARSGCRMTARSTKTPRWPPRVPRSRSCAATSACAKGSRSASSPSRPRRQAVGEAAAMRPASLSAELRHRRKRSELMRVALDPAADDRTLLVTELASLGRRDLVLVVRRAHLHPAQQAAVAAILAQHPEAIVLSAAEPYDAALWPEARNVACLYGDDELALRGAADVLTGVASAAGHLPIAIV